MKKIILISLVLVGVSFASCEKDTGEEVFNPCKEYYIDSNGTQWFYATMVDVKGDTSYTRMDEYRQIRIKYCEYKSVKLIPLGKGNQLKINGVIFPTVKGVEIDVFRTIVANNI